MKAYQSNTLPLWISVLVLLAGAFVTERAWHWTYDEELKAARNDFRHACDEAVSRLEARLNAQDQVLFAAEGLVSVAVISRVNWLEFAARLDLDRLFPGIQAVHYSPRIDPANLQSFLARRRVESDPGFSIYPPGERDAYQPIWYTSPETNLNRRALGYDMATDSNRLVAMDRARDLDKTTMTGKLLLVQDDKPDQPGFLMFHPLYSGKGVPSLELRRKRHAGFISVAMRMQDFVRGTLFSSPDTPYEMKVYDAAMPAGNESLMFDSDVSMSRRGHEYHHESVFAFGGGAWQAVFDSTQRFESEVDHGRSTLALNSGMAITLLVTLVAWSLAGSRRRVLQQVDAVTADLRASQERFELVIAATEEGIWDRDLVAHRTYVSPRFEEIMGVPPGSLNGQIESVRGLLHPDDVSHWEAALAAHLEQRLAYDVQYRVRHSSGDWRWVQSRGQAVWDSEGKPVRMVGALNDITEKKMFDLHLLKQREFLTRMIDVIPDPIVVKDRNSRYVLVNRAYAEKVGKPVAEIIGKSTPDLFSETTATEIVALDRRILRSGDDQVKEIQTYDARYAANRNVVIKKSLTVSPDGEPLMVSIHTDITDLRRALARFEAVIDDTPLVAVVGLDRDGRVDYWNKACESLYALKKSDVMGKVIGELLFAGEAAKNFQQLIDWVWTSGQATSPAEYLIPLANGKRVWIYSGLFPVVENGVVTEVFGTGIDISSRRQFEDELKQHRIHLEERVAEQTAHLLHAKNEAERANHAKSEFLANMSHELRTPLHGVLSFAKIGATKATTARPEKLMEYFERVGQSGERLLILLNDLLDLSKLEAGKMVIDKHSQDLQELLQNVVGEFEASIESKSLTLRIDTPTCATMACVDGARVSQVVRNLVSNAIKFTPAGRSIRIGITAAELRDGYRATDTRLVPALCLKVTDEGVGIPEDEMQAIFDKFVQSSRTRTGAGGTGLGLAICKEIVDAHRGAISACNNPHGGATFEVVFPCGD